MRSDGHMCSYVHILHAMCKKCIEMNNNFIKTKTTSYCTFCFKTFPIIAVHLILEKDLNFSFTD
jgi:hypothetical protein